MKLYLILDADEGVLAWAGTQSDAKKAKKARPGAEEVREFDFPTSKPELLELLNRDFVSKTDDTLPFEPTNKNTDDKLK